MFKSFFIFSVTNVVLFGGLNISSAMYTVYVSNNIHKILGEMISKSVIYVGEHLLRNVGNAVIAIGKT